MTLSLSQDTASASVPIGSTITPPLVEIAQGFAQFRAEYPNSSFTAAVESHSSTAATQTAATQREYIVCATLSLDGQPFITALGAAVSIEAAEDRARLRCLALDETLSGWMQSWPKPSKSIQNLTNYLQSSSASLNLPLQSPKLSSQ